MSAYAYAYALVKTSLNEKNRGLWTREMPERPTDWTSDELSSLPEEKTKYEMEMEKEIAKFALIFFFFKKPYSLACT